MSDIPTTEGEVTTEDLIPTGDGDQGNTKLNEEQASVEASSNEGDGSGGQEQLALNDIALALGLEETDLDVTEEGQVVLKTKVDGVEGTVTFKDSKDSYQIRSNLDRKGMEANQLREQLKAQQAEQEKTHTEKLEQLDGVIQFAWSELNQEYQNVDWNSLRAEDPAEYAAKLAEFQNRQKALQDRYQAVQSEKQTTFQKQNTEYLNDQEQKLFNVFPEWRDMSIGEKALTDIRQYSTTLGLTTQEANNLTRAADIIAYQKAKLYDDLQKSKPDVQKLVKRAPKVSKAGQSQPTTPKSIEDVFYGT